jgi:CRISPR/Cas system CSM-associated protein Csm2 small subunit
MTKSENRAAAKAHAEERERQREEAARLEAVKADLEQLAALRNYLIFRKRSREPAEELIKAIDDYVEKLTGDRRTLHAQNHSIG